MGFKIQILAGLSLGAVWQSANAAMAELNESGTTIKTAESYGTLPEGQSMNDLLGVPEIYELESRYGRYEHEAAVAR